ncbi:MAG: hypothetical protein U9R00_01730 [Patescibacteria group bacterium]|nr:hypothetical protein [Patescibacteria group bacterium]
MNFNPFKRKEKPQPPKEETIDLTPEKKAFISDNIGLEEEKFTPVVESPEKEKYDPVVAEIEEYIYELDRAGDGLKKALEVKNEGLVQQACQVILGSGSYSEKLQKLAVENYKGNDYQEKIAEIKSIAA